MTMDKQKEREYFQEKLKDLLASRRYSQADLARGLGIRPATIWTWVSGDIMPRPTSILKICDFLHVPDDYFKYKEESIPDVQVEEIPAAETNSQAEIGKQDIVYDLYDIIVKGPCYYKGKKLEDKDRFDILLFIDHTINH